MSSDPLNRWADEPPEVFDGRRTARLIARGEPPQAEGEPVAILAERALGLREAAASAGQFQADDRLMRLTAAAPDMLRPGARIRGADGQSWTIIVVRTAPAGAGAQVIVRRLPWSDAETVPVDLFRADCSKAASGEAEIAWVLRRSAVPVRMQPLERAVEDGDRAGAPRSGERWLVWFDSALFEELEAAEPLDHRCRLRDASGRWFGVVAVRDRQRIDRPAVVEVEAVA